ncbi:MAG: glycogen-binding domain-containing protein [Spirochaetota bacterium]
MAKTNTKRITFVYENPDAKSVAVAGSFCNWEKETYKMKKESGGTWKKTVSLAPGRYEYRFLVDGEWADDAKCQERVSNEYGTDNCVLRVE